MNKRFAGFTLLEVMLAVAIAVMLLVIAVPTVTSIFAEEDLQKSFTEFDQFVQRAQDRAIKDKRTVLLIWTKESIEAVLDTPAQEESTEPVSFPLPTDGAITIDRPAALDKKAPLEWAFWRSGACEPVRVYYEGPAGSWIADYEALTGRGRLFTMQPK